MTTTIQRVHANIDQLLDIESRARRKASRRGDALVHAGKMASVGRMVAGIDHEIKWPLASIRLFTEASLESLQQGDIARVTENLQRMLRVVDMAADLSRRLEGFSRQSEADIALVPLAAVIADALAVLKPQSAQCEIRVRCDERCVVLADRDRLAFVLVNLVDNAIAASRHAPLQRVEITTDTVESEDAGCVVLRVRDHGAGLNGAALEHLFKEFFTTKPVGQGLGLGLALAAEMMAEMGGRIAGGNHPDGGAEFTLDLSRTLEPLRSKPARHD